MAAKDIAKRILSRADVRINGSRPGDIKVHDERFYARVLAQGSLGLGESYMDCWWDCDELDVFFTKILRANLQSSRKLPMLLPYIQAKFTNMQRKSRAFEIGRRHYDIGNDLYGTMLDKRMTYTCGYWKDARTLDDAQEAKLELACRKIGLRPGMTVLDIGCGWGSFVKYAAEKYGVSAVGITVSKEQVALARSRCKGLPVKILLQDYRDVRGKYDRIVSLGMFEHVGYRNYRKYMEVAHRCLEDDGLFLLHTIGGNRSVKSTDTWIAKYIFPNSMLPSAKQISAAIEGLFVMEDWHNFSAYYDLTLMQWYKNFDAGWRNLKDAYGPRFYRMWKYYLLSCAGSFRSRQNQLWQVVLSKSGVPRGYVSLR